MSDERPTNLATLHIEKSRSDALDLNNSMDIDLPFTTTTTGKES